MCWVDNWRLGPCWKFKKYQKKQLFVMKAMIYLFCFLKVCYSNVFLACIFANTKDIIVTKIVVNHKTAPEAIFLNHGSFNIIVRNKNIYIYIFLAQLVVSFSKKNIYILMIKTNNYLYHVWNCLRLIFFTWKGNAIVRIIFPVKLKKVKEVKDLSNLI